MRLWPGVLAAAIIAGPLAGCGGSSHPGINPVTASTRGAGSGHKTFSAPGMALHFTFPAGFKLRIARSRRVAGNTSQASEAAVGISRFDLLIVSRFPHRPIPVTRGNIVRLQPQFDAAVSTALGHKVRSSVTTLGGLPALTYPSSPVSGLPVKVSSRIAEVFVADDEYELNCQYTSAESARMAAACGEMLSSLSVKR
jgi:hypothetical protein